jgi:hypothetical protein
LKKRIRKEKKRKEKKNVDKIFSFFFFFFFFFFLSLSFKKAKPINEDDRVWSSLNQGLGNDPKVNWALCNYNVAPLKGAFLSLPLRGLTARVPATAARVLPSKALAANVSADEVPILVVGRDIPLDKYRAISELVRVQHISQFAPVFAHDCTVGVTRDTEHKLRLVADGPVPAIFASHLFARTPALAKPSDFKHPFTAFFASHLVLADPARYGVKHSRLAIVNPSTGTAVFVGTPLSTVAQVFSTLLSQRLLTPPPPPPAAPATPPPPAAAGAPPAAPAAATPPPPPPPLDAVPLRSDAVEYGKVTALIIGATDAMRAGGLRRFLVGPELNVWHEGGVSAVFAGTTFAGLDLAATERNDLVLESGSSHAVATKCAGVRARPLADPSALVIVVDDAKLPASASLTPAEAAKHIITGYRGGDKFVGARTTFGADALWARSAARIEELLRKRNTQAVVVNVAGNKSVGAVEKLLIDVLSKAHTPKAEDTSAYTAATNAKIDAQLKK